MKPRTLLVLLALVLAVGSFVVFYERDLPSTSERLAQEKKVLAIDRDDVRAITVGWRDGRVRLEREPRAGEGEDGKDGGDGDGGGVPVEARWRLVEPLAARADRAAVDAVLGSLVGLEKERTLRDVNPATLGLDDPEVKVTLETGKGETVLAVGAEVPASSDRIVAVEGRGGTYQVRGGFVSDLTREPGEWRDKQLFTATRNDGERLTLVAGESRVLLARRGEDYWIESPLVDRADEDHVNTLLTELTGLRVAKFLDDTPLDPPTLGLEPPERVLEAILAGHEAPFRLELGTVTAPETAGEGAGRFYGRADRQLFEIDTRLGEAFDRSPAAWRSRAWTALQVFKIESARLVDGEGELQVTRDGADWMRGEERIDYTTASDLLYAITDVEAEEVVERAAATARGHRFAEPWSSFHLATNDGEEELLLYPSIDGLAAATASGRDAVLLLTAETVGKIRGAVDNLRRAVPLADEGKAEEDAEPADTSSDPAEPQKPLDGGMEPRP